MEPASLSSVELTRILQAWSAGEQSALDKLTPVVYDELHRLARQHMARESGGHPMQPSDLVNEAFIRLMANPPAGWSGRTQFFGFSAHLMRQILIDFARAQDTGKRGRGAPHMDLSGIADREASKPYPVDFLDLDTALSELAVLDRRQAEIVELRYFGGLANSEIAEVLGVSEPTIVRQWRLARAWLFDRLRAAAELG